MFAESNIHSGVIHQGGKLFLSKARIAAVRCSELASLVYSKLMDFVCQVKRYGPDQAPQETLHVKKPLTFYEVVANDYA